MTGITQKKLESYISIAAVETKNCEKLGSVIKVHVKNTNKNLNILIHTN